MLAGSKVRSRVRRVRVISLLTSVVLLTSCGPWSGADRFVAGLRCGMSRQEVREYAASQKLRVSEMKTTAPDYPHLVVKENRTRTSIGCWFRDDQLATAQIWWNCRPMGICKRPLEELCS
jgi:hypothetical protein